MNFDFKSQGWKHEFRMDSNELIIECYDHNNYHIGNIKIIIDDKEKVRLRRLLK